MRKEVDSAVLNRYLKGTYTPDDYQQLKSWFEKNGQTEQLDELIRQNWLEFKEQQAGKDLNFILQKIQRKIYLEEKSGKTSLWHVYRQVAAVLLFPVLLITSYLLINNSLHEEAWVQIHSPAGARTQFMLPDGSSGWLNSGSSIQYAADFKTREVKISGEAWFEVTKKNHQKFVPL